MADLSDKPQSQVPCTQSSDGSAHRAVAPPPAADVPPLLSIGQITPAIQSSPTVARPSKAPGAVSIMPSLFVKSGQRRRRAIVVVTGVIVAFVALIVGVMVFSQMRH